MMKNSKIRRILMLLACAVLLVSLSVGATLAYLTSTSQTVKNTFTVGNVAITLDETNTDNFDQFGSPNVGVGRDNGNVYDGIVPGGTYEKDPTVTVLANSADCYVRVKVTVTLPNWEQSETGEPVIDENGNPVIDPETGEVILGDPETFEEWAASFASDYILSDRSGSGFNAVDWTVITPSVMAGTIDTTNRTVEYILTYKNGGTNNIVKKDKDNNTALPAIFDDFYVPTNLDNAALAKLAGMSIEVVAEAIQADGFTGESEAAVMAAAWKAFEDQNK